MLYTELNEYDMQNMLKAADRDNFSLDALRAYISFIEEIGENTEFDPVGFDCANGQFEDWCTSWAKNPNQVRVKYLGDVNHAFLEKGVICASFNAG